MSSVRVPTDRVPTYDSARIKLQSIFELRELLRYRFLVWNLVSRDLKVRYKRVFPRLHLGYAQSAADDRSAGGGFLKLHQI